MLQKRESRARQLHALGAAQLVARMQSRYPELVESSLRVLINFLVGREGSDFQSDEDEETEQGRCFKVTLQHTFRTQLAHDILHGLDRVASPPACHRSGTALSVNKAVKLLQIVRVELLYHKELVSAIAARRKRKHEDELIQLVEQENRPVSKRRWQRGCAACAVSLIGAAGRVCVICASVNFGFQAHQCPFCSFRCGRRKFTAIHEYTAGDMSGRAGANCCLVPMHADVSSVSPLCAVQLHPALNRSLPLGVLAAVTALSAASGPCTMEVVSEESRSASQQAAAAPDQEKIQLRAQLQAAEAHNRVMEETVEALKEYMRRHELQAKQQQQAQQYSVIRALDFSEADTAKMN